MYQIQNMKNREINVAVEVLYFFLRIKKWFYYYYLLGNFPNVKIRDGTFVKKRFGMFVQISMYHTISFLIDIVNVNGWTPLF